jgi:glycosyltransferase involved in cell wall biosynthesis
MFESEKVMESKIILVVGTSYVHKNRIWAIKLMEKLLKIDDRYLVIFCGPDPRYGHTRLEDDIYVQQNLSFLSNNLIFPGWVNDELYNYFVENSDLVLYPSIEEGFGLVPFEITTKNRACLFGRVGIFKNSEFVNSNIRFLSPSPRLLAGGAYLRLSRGSVNWLLTPSPNDLGGVYILISFVFSLSCIIWPSPRDFG